MDKTEVKLKHDLKILTTTPLFFIGVVNYCATLIIKNINRMKNLLWLDDIRNPFLNEEGKVPTDKNGEYYNINWVLNYEQFVKWIELFGLPDAISFDHDLADEHYTPEYFWDNYEESKKFQEWRGQSYQEKTGMDCAKWLVDYCMDNKKKLPEIFVHSANPVGADNIKGLLDNFTKHCS